MMFEALDSVLGPLAADGVATLVDAAIKAAAVLLAAAAVAAFLSRRSAAERHLVWTIAIFGALAMPLLSRVAPPVSVPLPGLTLPGVQFAASRGEAASARAEEPSRPRPADGSARASEPTRGYESSRAAGATRGYESSRADGSLRALEPSRTDAIDLDPLYRSLGIGDADRETGIGLRTEILEQRMRRGEIRTDAAELRLRALEGRVDRLETTSSGIAPAPTDGSPARVAAGREGVSGAGLDIDSEGDATSLTALGPAGAGGPPSSSPDLATLLIAVWLAGATLVLGSFVLGRARLHLIARRARLVQSGRLSRVTDLLSARVGIATPPRLLVGDADSIPMTWGLWRSVILLPEGALEWAPWRLEAVLRHELGHVGRRDYLAQVGAQIACALYWFNPLAWIAAHRLCVEREHACDDLVLAGGHDPADYAADLIRLARSFRSGGRADAAALAMTRSTHLKDRLIAMLDDTRNRTPTSRRLLTMTVAAALAIVIPLAALTPGAAPDPSRSSGSTEGSQADRRTRSAPEPARTPAPEAAAASDAEPWLGAAADLPAPRESAEIGAAPWIEARPLAAPPATLVSVALATDAQQATVLCNPADGAARRSSHMVNDDVTMIEAEYGGCRSWVRIEGEITFSDDFSRISRISSRGMLRVEVDRGGVRRRVEATPGSGGAPEYRWSVDGRNEPFDEQARAWLDGALIDLFRGSSFQAEERAASILSREGPEGVLAEVRRMWSGHGQARYIGIALASGTLTQEQVRQAIQVAGDVVESDHALGEVLMQAAASYSFDSATRTVFLQAARSLESDHQQGRVFEQALARGDLDSEQLETLLEAAATDIESDHQLAEILVGLADRYPLETALRDPFLRAAATLESDHQQGRVYGIVLQQSGLRPDELAAVLEAAMTIESDHQLGELLVAATAHDLSDETLRSALLRAAGSIESSHNRGRVYEAALENTRLSDTDLASVLASSRSIDSDHTLASLLARIADERPDSRAVHRAYLEAAGGIESSHNLSNVLTLFVRNPSVGEAELIGALEAARRIDSDHNLAGFLIEFADGHRVDGPVREAFLRTLDMVESEHQHGRVSSRIVGGG